MCLAWCTFQKRAPGSSTSRLRADDIQQAAIWRNDTTGSPVIRSLIAYDH
jgi:hypothetical protein